MSSRGPALLYLYAKFWKISEKELYLLIMPKADMRDKLCECRFLENVRNKNRWVMSSIGKVDLSFVLNDTI